MYASSRLEGMKMPTIAKYELSPERQLYYRGLDFLQGRRQKLKAGDDRCEVGRPEMSTKRLNESLSLLLSNLEICSSVFDWAQELCKTTSQRKSVN